MKKVLLSSFLLAIFALPVLAYETIIINFPDREQWVKAFYRKTGTESILQYVPYGQARNDWRRSVVIHSYKNKLPVSALISNNSVMLTKVNPTGKFKTIKMTPNDAIIWRCTDDYKDIEGQCEFFRATRGFEGNITIHYMNKNKDDFMHNYHQWLSIMKRAKVYNSYYRNERMLNKSEYFEI